jgi:hypothetical protein
LRRKRNIGLRQLGEHVEFLLLQPATENAVEYGHIDLAGFQRLRRHRLIADDEKSDLVALGLQAQMLESEHGAHPYRARQRLHADFFAAQFLGPLDAPRRDDIVTEPVGERGDGFKIGAARYRHQRGRAAGVGRVHVPGGQRGHEHRCLADKNRVRLDTVLNEKSVIISDPKRRHPRIQRRVADDDLALGRSRIGINSVS